MVIGGLGSLWGTLLGGVVLGVAQQIGAQINISDQLLAGHLVFLAAAGDPAAGADAGRRSMSVARPVDAPARPRRPGHPVAAQRLAWTGGALIVVIVLGTFRTSCTPAPPP